MKGKIIAWLIIGLVGIPLLLFFGTALILFLAPGVEIFGIRYVAKGVCNFSDEKTLESFSGNVYVNAYDVPISIEYAAIPGMQVTFKQEFVGFTNTHQKQPSLSVEKDSDGNAVISTVEIQKFIFASELYDSYYLIIRLPSQNRDVKINAETSPVNFKGVKGNSPRVDIFSEGKFSVSNDMTIGTLTLNTNSDVDLPSNLKLTNATISTKNKYINITNKVTGDLDLKNTSGNITFKECNNLKVNTSSGVVKSNIEAGIIVNGKAEVTTKSGSVYIDKILGTSEASIFTTKTGEINIGYVNDVNITSNRGLVSVNQARTINVEGGSGEIYVGGALNKVNINATNGKVTLGKEDGATISNPTVKTTTGKIYAYNTYGIVSLTSSNNLVYIKNTKGVGANSFKLHAGRELTAVNLEGVVDIYANGEVKLHFQSLTEDVNVKVGTKCKDVEIDAKCKLYDEVNYNIKSSKNKDAIIFAGDNVFNSGNPLVSNALVAAPTITVSGAYQTTRLYLNKL